MEVAAMGFEFAVNKELRNTFQMFTKTNYQMSNLKLFLRDSKFLFFQFYSIS